MQTFDIPLIAAAPLADDLAAEGFATRSLFAAEACRELAALYNQDARFRKRVIMEQHAYGKGEYKYFAYPLPDPVAALRAALYPPLAGVANAWRRMLGEADVFPDTLDAWLARCHAAGQTRPTPLMLRYGAGGFNCLHQDLYGDLAFPLTGRRAFGCSRRGFYRRRVHAGGAAATRAVARYGGAAPPG